jgi:alkylation response protein AidB-like acyl-CoA dehydrogenase
MELDPTLRRLRDEVRDHAAGLRALALAVDAGAGDMTPYLDVAAVQAVHRLTLPPARPSGGRCLETVVAMVEAARGDVGVTLGCPGPAVAGAVIDLLADDAQRDRFRAALADGRTWAFCAITEPAAGSDAMRMSSRLRTDGDRYLLSGTKRYIGNAARGAIGVVFARTGPSPVSIRAVLVDVPRPGVHRAALDMVGLRGAQIGELTCTDVVVDRADLLGNHLPTMRRGMWGAINAFANVRVQVGAMAVGTADAVCDYVTAERRELTGSQRAVLTAARAHLDAVRDLLYRAAAEVDVGQGRGHLASLAKYEAVTLGSRLVATLPRLLGPGALLEHPLLEKWRRDVMGMEFMEGTSTMQRLNVAQGYLRHGVVGVGG